MSGNLDPNAWGYGYNPRPYRQLYPPERVNRRRIVTTKDEVQIDEAAGTEIRLPVEQRPPQRTKRITRVDDRTRGDQTR
ncbi:MAG: hypothetical protein ACRDSZ_15385 [Pseudonocardiaceae bacterium]